MHHWLKLLFLRVQLIKKLAWILEKSAQFFLLKLQLYIPVHMILLCVSYFFEMFDAVSFSRSLWLIQTHSLLLVLWRSKNGNSSGIVSVSERRILPHIAWGEVSLLDSDTVFDLGFPAKGTMTCVPVNNFQRDISGGHYIFFIITLTDRVFKLCYQQMQWSRVNWTYSLYLDKK